MNLKCFLSLGRPARYSSRAQLKVENEGSTDVSGIGSAGLVWALSMVWGDGQYSNPCVGVAMATKSMLY